MIKAVFFDASETLIFLPEGVAHHYAKIARRHGLDLDEQKLAEAFRVAWKRRPARAVIATARSDDDKPWWRDLVADVFAQCGAQISAEKFADFFEEVYAHFAQPGVWELFPDVRPTLEQLRGNFALGVISNFDRRLYKIFDQLQIAHYFSAIVLSSETGADKPHPQIFQRALEKLRVQPHEALHAGDDPVHDWQGAVDAGLHCFRLDRRVNSLLDLPAQISATNQSGS